MTDLCKAELHIGDDHGDNSATMTCGLELGHAGAHQEVYPRGDMETVVTVTWHGDDRPDPVTCARCGKAGTTAEFMIEEGDEWECPECWERCEAQLQGQTAGEQ